MTTRERAKSRLPTFANLATFIATRQFPVYVRRMVDSFCSFSIRSCFTVVVALVAFALIAVPPAQAEVLVSNIEQSADGEDANLGGIQHFQGFVTGSNEKGYHLSSIEVHYKTLTLQGQTEFFELLEGTTTGTTVTELSGDSITAPGIRTFTPDTATVLKKDTTYYFYMYSNFSTLSTTLSASEDESGHSDFNVLDVSQYRVTSRIYEWDPVKRIRINGSAVTTDNDATLRVLSASPDTLSPEFAPTTLAYSVSVGNSISQITLLSTALDVNATVEFLGSGDQSLADADANVEGHQVNLALGANTIKVKVTARNGTTTKIYTVTVTRSLTASTDATLNALELSNGTLSPTFATDHVSYTASVQGEFAQITVTPTATASGSTIEYLNATDTAIVDADTDKDGHQIALSIGANTIKVKVTADDRTTTKTYTLTVTRLSNDPSLRDLSMSDGALQPSFARGTTTYYASVRNTVDQLTVTPTKSHAGTTLSYPGSTDADTNTAGHQVDLTVGDNTINVKGTSEDGTQSRTYTVNVWRSNLLASAGTTFVSNLLQGSDYGRHFFGRVAMVFKSGRNPGGYTLSSVNIRYIDVENDAFSLSLCSADTDGFPTSECTELMPPSNFAAGALTFTAPANTQLAASKSYAVVVDPSASARAIALRTTFSSSEDIGSSGWSMGAAFSWAYRGQNTWNLNPYGDALLIAINAEVVRSDDATLSALTLSDGTLDPAFAAATEDYTASVEHASSQLTIAPTLNDSDATVEFLDSADAALADADSDTDGHQVDLDVGANTIKVKVTAPDTTTTKTYTVLVTRAQPLLTLNVDAIATDNVINIKEKADGFTIGGDTGTEAGVSVVVKVGSHTFDAVTSTDSDDTDSDETATWSVSVPAAATYITGTSVAVDVTVSKTGFTAPAKVTRTLTIDLTAPTAPTYTAPTALKVGEAITDMSPDRRDRYR